MGVGAERNTGAEASAPALWTRLARASVRLRGDAALAVLDAALLASAFLITLLLRFDGSVPSSHWRDFRTFLPVALLVCLAAFKVWGLYGQIWRHASVKEAQRLIGAGFTAGAVLITSELVRANYSAPLSVVIFGTGLGLFFCGTARFQSRLFSFRRNRGDASGLRVIVIGGRDAGAALLAEMLRHPQMGFRPVAVLDPDPRLHGRSVMGIPVKGDIAALRAVGAECDAHQAILAMSSAGPEIVAAVAAAAEEAEIALKIVPDIKRRMGAGVSIRDMRDVSIDDLLGRTEVVTDLDAVRRLLHGRRVLITGAGGSIGSEIARQVARCEPASLVLLDHDETHLHDVATTLEGEHEQVLANIRDRDRVLAVFRDQRPEVVFHAAALKHVPLLETHPCEAAETNVGGTLNVLEACRAVAVEHFVFVSTDKAVDPSSVMGASKRIGEQLVLSLAPDDAPWCAVRFGNVLGSRGSVIPTFMRQIAAGGPVTVTDHRMTRYFMSIEEAVQLVLQASVLSRGGEVFVLDMGVPVRIYDLAERMIRLSGRRVGADVEIVVTGVRPGEKLTEELHRSDEAMMPTIHPSISQLGPTLVDSGALLEGTDELRRLATGAQDTAVRTVLFALASLGEGAGPAPAAALDAAR